MAEADALLVAEKADTRVDVFPVTTEELLEAQLADEFCARLRSRLNGGEELPFAFDDSGLLHRCVEPHFQIVVPPQLRSRILHLAHYPQLAGHPGWRKLYYTVRRDFYWPSLPLDCLHLVRNCVTCAKNRIKLRKAVKRVELFPAKAPLEFVSIDLLGPLLRTRRGHEHLLVITDRFSKLVRTVPMKRITAGDVAKAFVTYWIFVYGPPVKVLSDNGKQFTAKFFMDVCRILGVKNVFTTTYHPQTNGQAERFNRTILTALRHYTAEHPKDWDLFTDALTYAYNTQVHSTTQVAPFELVVSRKPPPLAIESQPTIQEVGDHATYKEKWKSWLSTLMSTAETAMKKVQNRYKANYDRRLRANAEIVKAGDRVFVRKDYTNPRTETKHKLAPVATGPYLVVNADNSTVVIQHEDQQERVARDRVVLAPSAGIAEVATRQDETAVQLSGVRGSINAARISRSRALSTQNAGLADLPPLHVANRRRGRIAPSYGPYQSQDNIWQRTSVPVSSVPTQTQPMNGDNANVANTRTIPVDTASTSNVQPHQSQVDPPTNAHQVQTRSDVQCDLGTPFTNSNCVANKEKAKLGATNITILKPAPAVNTPNNGTVGNLLQQTPNNSTNRRRQAVNGDTNSLPRQPANAVTSSSNSINDNQAFSGDVNTNTRKTAHAVTNKTNAVNGNANST